MKPTKPSFWICCASCTFRGHTILVVTHSQTIGNLADRRVELEHGRLARISVPSLAKE